MSKATSSSVPGPAAQHAGRPVPPCRAGRARSPPGRRRTASCGPLPSEIVQPCCSAQPCAPTRSASVAERPLHRLGGARARRRSAAPPVAAPGAAVRSGRRPVRRRRGRQVPAGRLPGRRRSCCRGLGRGESAVAGSAAARGAPARATRCPRRPGRTRPLAVARTAHRWLALVVRRLPQPYVSRGPRPRTVRGPFFQLGAVGPTTRNRVTTSPPTWARSLPRIVGASSRSCVAQAVDSATTSSSPSVRVCGAQCAAMSGPTSAVPAAEHRADPGALRPVLLGDQRVDQPAERLGVVGARPGTGPLPPRPGDPAAGGLRPGGRRGAGGLQRGAGDVAGPGRPLVAHATAPLDRPGRASFTSDGDAVARPRPGRRAARPARRRRPPR